MMRTLRYTLTIIAALLVVGLSAQTWDRVNGSMQTRSNTGSNPLVIIDQLGTGKPLSVRYQGTEKFSVASTGTTLTQPLSLPLGTAAAVSLNLGTAGTGLYAPGAGRLALAFAGTYTYEISNVRFFIGQGADIGFSPNAGAADVAISRAATAKLNLTDTNTTGVGLDFSSDAVLSIRTRAQNAAASLLANLQIASTLINGTTGFLVASNTAPTISSGFGSGASIPSANGTLSFRINVGTGGTANSGVIGLPTASNGWNCFATDITTPNTGHAIKQSATSTTSATITNYNSAGTATAWTASDILIVSCHGY